MNNLWEAFVFSAFTSAFIVVMAIYINHAYDQYTIEQDKKEGKIPPNHVTRKITLKGVLITFAITFAAYMGGYAVMYLMFGYKINTSK